MKGKGGKGGKGQRSLSQIEVLMAPKAAGGSHGYPRPHGGESG